ncbi:hypothetical protein V1514DRAFT_311824 [Lipomyces japonicus]|uniref:uncharacterized protein n=1 Tax=Lipomyces japonicus TaxID=56871 RepID=UPI0034CE585A
MSKLHQTQQLFYKEFQNRKNEINKLFTTKVVSSEGGELITVIESKLTALNDDVTNSQVYLAPYDQRAYAVQLDELSKGLEELRQKVSPTPRFLFSNRQRKLEGSNGITKAATISSTYALDGIPVYQIKDFFNSFVKPEYQSSDKKSGQLTLSLSNIKSSIIFVESSDVVISNVQVNDVTDSILIILPEVSGPVHLSKVNSSLVVVQKAHQLRIHESKTSTICVSISGRGIIETSRSLLFGNVTLDETSRNIRVGVFTGYIDDFDHPTATGPSSSWKSVPDGFDEQFQLLLASVIETSQNSSELKQKERSQDLIKTYFKI